MVFKKKSSWTPELIESMIQEGKTMTEIGEHFRISKQRVKQICQRHNLTNGVQHRKALRAKKYFDKWGPERLQTEFYAVCREKFRSKKAQALSKGIDWTVSFGELEWPEKCPILGIELDYFLERLAENSPSFDRIDPSRGYVAGNVRVVSWRANRIKNDGSANEHRLIADYLDKLSEGT
jgi:hypothetical protein